MDGWMDMIVTGKKGDGSISKKKIQKKIMIGRIFIYYCEKIAKKKKGCMQSVSVWVVFFLFLFAVLSYVGGGLGSSSTVD